MASKFGRWWQKVKQHWVAIGIVGIGLMVVITLIIFGYWLDWTGFNGNNKSGKTLWDWLQLLIVPFVLAIGGLRFSQIQKDREQNVAEQRAQTEQEIAQDNQQEAALQEYISKMSELLLEKDLRKSGMDAEVRTIAHVRTLTVLRRLNGERKGDVLRFLCESGLIIRGKSIIDLHEADFTRAEVEKANLSGTDLSGADFFRASLRKTDLENTDLAGTYFTEADMACTNLRRANLTEAKLARTDLTGTNLSEANLSGANLDGAALDNEIRSFVLLDGKMTDIKYGQVTNLTGAKITQEQLNQASTLEGAIMPDGSKHP
jgi:uncharacterized protein YjbI with pentapeptide repeats